MSRTVDHWAAPLEQLGFKCVAQGHLNINNEQGAVLPFHFPAQIYPASLDIKPTTL